MSAQSPETASAQPQQRGLASRLGRLVRRCCFLFVGLLAFGMGIQLVLILTPASERLRNWLIVAEPPQKADLIVCLGGQYDRLLWTMPLMERGLAPKVVVSNAPGAAEYMKQILVASGVPRDRVLVDNTSYHTCDHPAGIARLPGVDHSKRLLIVTSKEHSRRAAACFRHEGFKNLTVYCGPTYTGNLDYFTRVKNRILLLPNVIYEYSALLQYWWQGRI